MIDWHEYPKTLPPKEGYYLCYAWDNVQVGNYRKYLIPFGELSDKGVTHWAELPAPPKQEYDDASIDSVACSAFGELALTVRETKNPHARKAYDLFCATINTLYMRLGINKAY